MADPTIDRVKVSQAIFVLARALHTSPHTIISGLLISAEHADEHIVEYGSIAVCQLKCLPDKIT